MSLIVFQLGLAISLCLPALMSYLLWPSFRNIPFIRQLSLVLVAYLGGTFVLLEPFLNSGDLARPVMEELMRLCVVLALGAFFQCAALMIGFHLRTPFTTTITNLGERVLSVMARPRVEVQAYIIAINVFGAGILVFSYWGMGFTPALAKNILLAKFFSGEYQAAYARYAAFFRAGLDIYAAAFLLLLCLNVKTLLVLATKWATVIVFFFCAVASLRRGVAFGPLVDAMLVLGLCVWRGKFMPFVVCIYLFIFLLGSASSTFLIYMLGIIHEFDWRNIFSGASDIADLVTFWHGYEAHPLGMSLGRTNIGALIPYRYEWNPSIVTLRAIGASVENTESGGFRLPPAIWGYIAYHIPGVIIWTGLQGLADGTALRLMRDTLRRPSLTISQTTTVFVLYFFVNEVILSLLAISLDLLVQLAIAAGFFMVAVMRFRSSRMLLPEAHAHVV